MIVAIVPAAGLSRRMGRPKLVLDVKGEPLLARVIRVLREGGAQGVIVVGPPRDQPGALEIEATAREAGASVLLLDEPTPDMRTTLQHGLDLLDEPTSGILIAPADSVGMTAGLVRRVVDLYLADPSRIVLPLMGEKRGHPLALPPDLARAIRNLPPDQGVNSFVRSMSSRTVFVEADDPRFADDLDTPEDYARALESS